MRVLCHIPLFIVSKHISDIILNIILQKISQSDKEGI